MIIEAVRKIIEAVRLFLKAARVLRSSENKSIPIDPRPRNNFLRSRFYPEKFGAIVRFASISQSFGLTRSVFVRSGIDLYQVFSFCFDITKSYTNHFRFLFDPANPGLIIFVIASILQRTIIIVFASLRSFPVLE